MATDDLDQLADWAAPLLDAIAPQSRRQIARGVAQDLRRRQTRRIAAQQNPDGTPYAPRKPQGRGKAGHIKRRAMFRKLRTARYIKARGTADAATVGFTGRAAVIARVHQLGKRARVERGGPAADYPVRRLLGYAGGDRDAIADAVIEHLKRQTL